MCAPSSWPMPAEAACLSSALPRSASPERDAQGFLPLWFPMKGLLQPQDLGGQQ